MPITHIIRSYKILQQIYLLRYITIGFILNMMMIALFILQIRLPILSLISVLALMGIFNLYTRALITRRPEVSEHLLFIQILFDIGAFSLVLFFSGGASSPFTFIYLISLAIAATVIPGKRTWILTATTILCYSLLLKFYQPLEYAVHDHSSMHADSQFSQHVLGMWFGFMLSALVVSWFITYLAQELRNRDQSIADARQRELRDQQVLTLGALAAGTAHELGTPLASLSIVTGDLTDGFDAQQYPELFNNQAILRSQIQRCKTILSRLSSATGQTQAVQGCAKPADEFLREVILQWKQQSPKHEYHTEIKLDNPFARLLYDQTVCQSLINLLNNSAQVSTEPLQIQLKENGQTIELSIHDQGDGMSDEQIAMAGEVSFSNKPDGLGIGLYIAITTMNRIGGDISFNRQAQGGNETLVTMPII